MKAHPLSAMFGASYHDREGKVCHSASGGGGFGEVADEQSLEAQIAQHQSSAATWMSACWMWRGATSPALASSPFVPEGQENTFARGLSSFLRGEASTAIFMLTPLVEAGMRWCLKAAGFEVTTFDDAAQTQEDKTLSAGTVICGRPPRCKGKSG